MGKRVVFRVKTEFSHPSLGIEVVRSTVLANGEVSAVRQALRMTTMGPGWTLFGIVVYRHFGKREV